MAKAAQAPTIKVTASEPSEAPPAPSEVADEPVKVGRRNLTQHDADRSMRYERRRALHEAYGTTSGRKGERA